METKLRQTAFKVRISDILNGKYIVQDGWDPNYITVNGNKVSRINIIGVVVSKQSNEISKNDIVVLDDGSGRITLRSFEEMDFSRVKLGDVVVTIGRPREYNGEVYVMPEIIRPLDDKRWADVRRMELGTIANQDSGSQIIHDEKNGKKQQKTEPEEILYDEEEVEDGREAKDIGQEPEKTIESPADRMMKGIKALDRGDGADFDEVIRSYGDGAENIINGLMKRGDIFELRPGKLKVLE